MTQFWKTFLLLLFSVSLAKGGIYETLEYGDTKEVVTNKLKQCERIENTAPDTMFGNVALNGSFLVKKELSGLRFALFFNWDDDGGLNEITLRSTGVEEQQFSEKLKPAFKQAGALIKEVYGNPVASNAMPSSSDIDEGVIINSHLWHVGGGSLLMGVAQQEGKYQLSIRFTQKLIEPAK